MSKQLINKAMTAARALRKAELKFQGSAHAAFVVAYAKAWRALPKAERKAFTEAVAEALDKSASSHTNWMRQADVYAVAVDVEGHEALPVGSMHRIVSELKDYRWKAEAKADELDVFYMTAEGLSACRAAVEEWAEKGGKDSTFPLRAKASNKADKATSDDAPESEGQSTKPPFVQVDTALGQIIGKVSDHGVEMTADQLAIIVSKAQEIITIAEETAKMVVDAELATA